MMDGSSSTSSVGLKQARAKDADEQGDIKRKKKQRQADEKQTKQTGTASASNVCTEQGHWNDDGTWAYPADKTIECSLCKSAFTFTGTEQAWYAARSLHAPVRCPKCIAARKEQKAEKVKSGRSGLGRCFNCGGSGHRSADCQKPAATVEAGGRKACYVCGSEAHLSRNCPAQESKKAQPSGCFTCGSTEHLSRECPQRPPAFCFNCGVEGHASKLCPKPQRAAGSICFAFQKAQCFRKKCQFAHTQQS